jgi:TrmH family RNA methyltransferase
MGSFLRVQVQYSPLETVFEQHPSIPVYGAVLGGESLFETALKKPAIVLIGNEGKGISHPLQQQINHRLTIPKTGAAESLNAAVATGIICAMFRQQC